MFWQIIRRLRGKNSSTTTSIMDLKGNILRDEKEILSRYNKYFEDLLNPKRTTSIGTDTINTTDFGKKEVFTLTKMAAAIRGLESGYASGEDAIRPEC